LVLSIPDGKDASGLGEAALLLDTADALLYVRVGFQIRRGVSRTCSRIELTSVGAALVSEA
jgi:hypothetical protein